MHASNISGPPGRAEPWAKLQPLQGAFSSFALKISQDSVCSSVLSNGFGVEVTVLWLKPSEPDFPTGPILSQTMDPCRTTSAQTCSGGHFRSWHGVYPREPSEWQQKSGAFAIGRLRLTLSDCQSRGTAGNTMSSLWDQRWRGRKTR